jgi:hypothetical protein
MNTRDTLARWIDEEKVLLNGMKNGRSSGFLSPKQMRTAIVQFFVWTNQQHT